MPNNAAPTALLIDDDVISLAFLSYVLTGICDTIPVSSEAEAFAQIRDQNIHVIIHDSEFRPEPGRLPRKITSGFKQRIREEHPTVRRICYYGTPEAPDIEDASLLPKTAKPKDIAYTTRRAMQQALVLKSIDAAAHQYLSTLARDIASLWRLSAAGDRNFAGVVLWLDITCRLGTETPLTTPQYEAVGNVLTAIKSTEVDSELKLACGEQLLKSGINLFAPMGIESESGAETPDEETQ